MKAFASYKIRVAHITTFVLQAKKKNIAEKEENPGHHYFLLFLKKIFQKPILVRVNEYQEKQLTLSQTTNVRLFQTESSFQTTNLNFMKTAENSLYWKKKHWVKENEQFLLFPQCFQKTYNADTKTPGLVWERVKSSF